MAEQPAYYARRGGPLADGWTLLHPPYTLWHLSYAVLGAALAPDLAWTALGLTVLAFFLAVGIAAHALDERAGHPLRTAFGDRALLLTATLALFGAVALGAYGAFWWRGTNWSVAVAVPVGVAVVVGYNLELAGGRLHNDLTFGLGWGGFPVVVGYLAQQPGLGSARDLAAVAATGAAVALTYTQRRLSTPARELRRRTLDLDGTLRRADGTDVPLTRANLLDPLEGALRALSWGVPLVALAALLTHA
ncbi:MAG TPA: hypothetical protein VGK78_15355 [Nocardioides sp.]|uniref:hypothetical protein n=1 Tax=Nocardioides sp. TaxID=35761 RepID=UPI002F3EC73C